MGFQDADETAYVGAPENFYKAWRKEEYQEPGEFRLPRDSGRKILESLEDPTYTLEWKYGRSKHRDTFDEDEEPHDIDEVPSYLEIFKESDQRTVREEITDHLQKHDNYNVDVRPADKMMKIWDTALFKWHVFDDDLQFQDK